MKYHSFTISAKLIAAVLSFSPLKIMCYNTEAEEYRGRSPLMTRRNI